MVLDEQYMLGLEMPCNVVPKGGYRSRRYEKERNVPAVPLSSTRCGGAAL
jgi:hypothetical protein